MFIRLVDGYVVVGMDSFPWEYMWKKGGGRVAVPCGLKAAWDRRWTTIDSSCWWWWYRCGIISWSWLAGYSTPFLGQVFHDDFPIDMVFEDSDGVMWAVFQVGEKRTVFMILDAPFLKEGIGGVCLGWVSFSIHNIYICTFVSVVYVCYARWLTGAS